MKLFSIFTSMFITLPFLSCFQDEEIKDKDTPSPVPSKDTPSPAPGQAVPPTTQSKTGFQPITKEFNKTKLSIVLGDITTMKVDAIVNAANKLLHDGSGVTGAIWKAAGPGWQAHVDSNTTTSSDPKCPVGEARFTPKMVGMSWNVIHTVGPDCNIPEEKFNARTLLTKCYTNSLQLALDHKLRTIAFPCISTAIFAFPPKEAAPVALAAVRNFLSSHGDDFDEIIFVCFLKEDYDIYKSLL
ncbi:MAG: macro domain-containing protein [Cytophagales bacterium]|nr:macro domain-containing protein [Cytophagales bacterium]